ncbi:MAG: major capsid protein P2 [Pseudomonadota bacterium]
MKLPDFNPVAAGQTATIKIPKWALTLLAITLRFSGGTMTKANIESITLKIGTRSKWHVPTVGALSGGTILDKLNKQMGLYDDANRLTINLWDPLQEVGALKEIGGWDMTKFSDDVYLEVKIKSDAVTPVMYANAWLTGPQGASAEDPNGQLVTALIVQPYSFSAGGRFNIPFEPKGALVKRLTMIYTGADGTATTNGNISKFDIKKNGSIQWELEDQENRFYLQERKRVPQAKAYLLDFCGADNLAGALVTAGAQSLEFAPTLTATDNGVIFYECLDAPFNLSN